MATDRLTPRGLRTRAALVQAGREVFEELGYAEASTDAVSTRAGVSHGTFYTYFDGKESLLREVVDAVVREIYTSMRVGDSVPEDQPYRRIEAANRLFLQAVTRNARILRVLDGVADTREDFRHLRVQLRESFLARGMEGLHRLDEDAAVDVLTRLWAGAIGLPPEAWPGG